MLFFDENAPLIQDFMDMKSDDRAYQEPVRIVDDGDYNSVRNACKDKQEQYHKAISFNFEVSFQGIVRQYAHEDLAAVEWRNRYEVEYGKAYVDLDADKCHIEQGLDHIGIRTLPHTQWTDYLPEQQGTDHCQKDIRYGPGKGYPDHVCLGILEIERVDGHWLCPSNGLGEEKYQGTHRIQVANGIEAQSAHVLCSRVSQFPCCPAMGGFMHCNSEEYRWGENQYLLYGTGDIYHFFFSPNSLMTRSISD